MTPKSTARPTRFTSWQPAGTPYTATYDQVGNMTGDGQGYTFIYDPFGRLTSISVVGTVAEYTYNGRGYRIGWHYDVDLDGTVEAPGVSGDSWFSFAYDERWRMSATYRDTDESPRNISMTARPGWGAGGAPRLTLH